MEKVIKRISAVAMAFALLGTGTTIAKNVNTDSVSTTTASAAKKQQNIWQRVNNVPAKKVRLTYFNGTTEVLKYSTMTVYYNINTPSNIRICFNAAPGVPMTIYRSNVGHVRCDR